nr:unnamed protein product [Spirometra erinaceieuropaei]
MSPCLPLRGAQFVTVVSVYDPTVTSPNEARTKFYEGLHAFLQPPRVNKLVVLGDFNTRVGTGYATWREVLGLHDFGSCKDNGLLL